MPQPFSRVVPNGTLEWASLATSPGWRSPEAEQMAFAAIASWSRVEFGLLQIFVQLMGGPGTLSATIFTALETQHAKKVAINAAAAMTLAARDDERKILDAVLALADTQQKSRNKLAHWVWACSPMVQNALILIDPGKNQGEMQTNDVFVFRLDELRDIADANERLWAHCRALVVVIQIKMSTSKRRGLIARLMADPDIAECMRRLATKKAKAKNSTQAKLK
jgi:hypothetical protein